MDKEPTYEIRTCVECGSEWSWKAHDGRKPTYCHKCKFVVAARKQRAATYKYPRTCLQCSREYMARRRTGKYCSPECHQKYMYRNGTLELRCKNCGKAFKRQPADAKSKKLFCDRKCMWADKIKHAPRSKKWTAVRKWFGRFGRMKACARCGYDTEPGILVLHHKDRNRDNNDLGNLEVLCPNCHALEHLKENKTGWKHKSVTKAYLRMLKARKENAIN